MLTLAPVSPATLTIGLLALGFNLVPVVLAARFKRFVAENPTGSLPDHAPKLSVFLPCKGVDPGLAANLEAILGQRYPDWELLFVVADEDDACLPVVREAIANHPEVRTKLVISGLSALCSEKNHNHLAGLAAADPASEAYVFIDSDIRPQQGWLEALVRPLGEPAYGASTGYRMIFPTDGKLASLLRSSWSLMSTAVLANDKLNGTWAGSMAITKATFERLGIAEKWKKALCDGPLVAESVKAAGLRIAFVPACVVATHESATPAGLVEWTNRQMAIAKVYLPRMWRTAFISYGLTNAFFLLSLVLLVHGLLEGALDPAVALLLTHAPLTWLMGALMLGALKQAVPAHAEAFSRLPLAYVLTLPLTSMLGLLNVVASLFGNRVTWRGVTYAIDKPDAIRIVARRAVAEIAY